MTTEGTPTLIDIPSSFDVIVANPPYIRQELLGAKEKRKIKELIESEYRGRVFVGAPPKKSTNVIILDKQSDIYVYFYIHAISILKNGGYLGFISSNKWLEVQYGEPFQQFLLSTCKVRYIIEFDRAVFPDAEVNTQVTILQKVDGLRDNLEREKNTVKFVHIHKPLPMNELIARIESEDSVEDEYIRINAIPQKDLKPGKWSTFLRASLAYFEVVRNKKLRPLEEHTGIVRGIMTGYDPYFILDRQKAKEWKIESKYLKPCAPAAKSLKGIVIEPKDIQHYFLIVREPKDNLRGTNVLKYIQFGEKLQAEPSKRRKERLKLTDVESIKSRPLWYELADLPEPSILFPMWFRYKYRPLLNNARCQSNNFYYYIVTSEQDKEVYGALLYSTLTQFLLEHIGRQYSGMLHIMAYELKGLPMIDPSYFSKSQKEVLKKLFWKLNDASIKINEANAKFKEFSAVSSKGKGLFEDEARERLRKAVHERDDILSQIDMIIYDTLGVSNRSRTMIANGLKQSREMRKMTTRGIRIEEEE